jgi:hypothetical protein
MAAETIKRNRTASGKDVIDPRSNALQAALLGTSHFTKASPSVCKLLLAVATEQIETEELIMSR